MSAQPGKIIQQIRIDTPRPRTIEDIRKDPKLAEQFVDIWKHLQDEVQRSRKEIT